MDCAKSDAKDILNGQLCAAARVLLGWSQERLRREAGVARRTISDFETGIRRPHSRIIRDIVAKFYENGVVLVKAADGKIGVIR